MLIELDLVNKGMQALETFPKKVEFGDQNEPKTEQYQQKKLSTSNLVD